MKAVETTKEKQLSEGREIAKRIAVELMGPGTYAVVMQGSFAYGGADMYSDIDIRCLCRQSREHYLLRREERLVSITNSTVGKERRRFGKVYSAYKVVQSWRDSIILEDPKGIAKELKREAELWSWEPFGDRPDRWAAKRITDYAEDVHRIIASEKRYSRIVAGGAKADIALNLSWIMAVQKRLLIRSEGRQADDVANVMGGSWPINRRRALGVVGASPKEGLEAALNMYRQAVEVVWQFLSQEQRAVVSHALGLIKEYIK